MKETWSLKNVMLMSILGVLFAAIYLLAFQGGLSIQILLTPLGLSRFSFELVYGVWFMAATVAMYIIRKPGVALVTEVLAAGIELFMGNSGGVVVILTGVIQGLGCELAFLLFRYKRFDLRSMTCAGVFAAVFIFGYELLYLEYYKLNPALLLAMLAVRFTSAFVFSALISKIACDGLLRTGVLKNYAIGAGQQDAEIMEDDE